MSLINKLKEGISYFEEQIKFSESDKTESDKNILNTLKDLLKYEENSSIGDDESNSSIELYILHIRYKFGEDKI